ncbi:MAG: type VII secretion protein EssB/YukC [Bilifractor sp.]|jgi:type VII secretion protein EssB
MFGRHKQTANKTGVAQKAADAQTTGQSPNGAYEGSAGEIKGHRYLREEVRKSSMRAQDPIDYEKICARRDGLLPCTYEEDREDLYFHYDLTGMKPVSEIKNESREGKYQFLINFQKLEELTDSYRFDLTEDNIYYDENYLVWVKKRDIYGRGEKPDRRKFLEQYKCFVAAVLGTHYSLKQLQESGVEICKNEKWFTPIYQCNTSGDVADILRKARDRYETREEHETRRVSRKSFLVLRIVAIVAIAAAVLGGGYAIYLSVKTVPVQSSLIAANESFIEKDYSACTEYLLDMDTEDMDIDTLYILAYSYANMESFRKDEMQNIIDSLSVHSSRQNLEYWIYIGRLQTDKAEETAMALSDDKLLVYAYMKEADTLENDTQMDGTEKQQRLTELESEIEKLGQKYETDENSVSSTSSS